MTTNPKEQAQAGLLKFKSTQAKMQANRLRLLANKPKPKVEEA